MNQMESLNETDYASLTSNQLDGLSTKLSSHIVKTEISNFATNLKMKSNRVNESMINDPDVQNLSSIVRSAKGTVEEEMVNQHEKVNFLREKLKQANSSQVDLGSDTNYEQNLKNIKSKLNVCFKKMLSIVQSIDFQGFGQMERPTDLTPSFDR
jgi:catabolite regulation protein CreA